MQLEFPDHKLSNQKSQLVKDALAYSGQHFCFAKHVAVHQGSTVMLPGATREHSITSESATATASAWCKMQSMHMLKRACHWVRDNTLQHSPVHGLPEVRSAQCETWQYITKFDIVMLTKTQSPALFGRQLSGYTVFTIPATSLGRAGEGVLLAVRQQLPFSVSHWQTDQANSTIWLTLKPAQSRHQPLTVGVCYIPPESHRSAQLSRRSAQVRFESLAAHIAQLSSGGPVLLAGDFNARVGAAAQPWITDLSDDPSAQLQNSDSTLDGHGRKLLHLCEETAMVLCTSSTGRTPGDTPAQPSFKARRNTAASRLDHALVDCGLFASIQACCLQFASHRQESDHFPLELRLLLTAPASPASLSSAQASIPSWVWDSSQRGPYASALASGPCQPLSTPAQLQPLLTCPAQQWLTVTTWSWHMPSCARPLMLQHKLHLFSANDPGQGVSPHICHATPGGIPDVSCFSHSCARPSFSAHAAPTFAFWNGDTRVTFDTAETPLLSAVSWSFLSCSKATRASSGRWCAFPVCCCLRSSGTQLPGTPSWASSPPLPHSMRLSCQLLTQHSLLCLPTASISLLPWLRWRLACNSFTMANQAPYMATLQSCCAMPSWCPPQRFQRQLICWRLALSCYSMRLSARGRCLNRGRLLWLLPSSRRGMPQTQPTTGQSQLASPSAGSR